MDAYILIQTEVGRAARVARELTRLPGVEIAEDVTGPYDVIVWASAPNLDALGRLAARDIQSVAGITRTLTCPIVRLG